MHATARRRIKKIRCMRICALPRVLISTLNQHLDNYGIGIAICMRQGATFFE